MFRLAAGSIFSCMFLLLTLALTACTEESPLTATSLSASPTPKNSSLTVLATASPWPNSPRPVNGITPTPSVDLTPEILADTSPSISLPTVNPTVIAQLPKFNGLPIIPVFNSTSTITLPLGARKANYGANGKSKVGIQAGHWRAENHPDELAEFRKNSGAEGGGMKEADLNLEMAQRVAALLEAQGIEVDVLPATPPVDYKADVFVALHADGDTTGRWHGFKIARSRYSLISKTDEALVSALYSSYGAATDLPRDDSHISANMIGYFAFNNRRYQHAISPLTPGAILEMGYVTNEGDRNLFKTRQQDMAQGIANGILNFLKDRPALEEREQPKDRPVIEATSDKTAIYTRPGGPVIGYLSKGQYFDWFESRDTYYMVDVPLLRQALYVKKSDFRSFTETLKTP